VILIHDRGRLTELGASRHRDLVLTLDSRCLQNVIYLDYVTFHGQQWRKMWRSSRVVPLHQPSSVRNRTTDQRCVSRSLIALGIIALVSTACGAPTGPPGTASGAACTPPANPVLTLAAYSTPREAYGKIIPAFQAKWKADHNETVIFQESYGGSTSQAQNIVNGFQADVAALSLAPDLKTLVDAGLVAKDWESGTNGGMVSASVVVFDVRPDNPRGLSDWNDLAQNGLGILTPDPASSGGARWNIVAAYGAAKRGAVAGYSGDPAGAQSLLTDIFRNVTVLDKSARDSIKNFESGNGDIAITYENEVLVAKAAGLPDEMIIPPSTVLIENPVAVVDANVDKHCVRAVAEAFVEYLHTPPAQDLYKKAGFLRPADPKAAAAGDGKVFAPIKELFTVKDVGGWDAIATDVFGKPDGVFTKAFAAAQAN
jgi:sulfate/thiosulfate transport system substrate-binding protein